MTGSQGSEEESSDHDISWVTVKKRKVVIPLSNRYDPLSLCQASTSNTGASEKASEKAMNSDQADVPTTDEKEYEHKPPEFCLDGVDNIEGMIKQFTGLTGGSSFSYKCLKDGTVKVQAKDIKTYKSLTHFLKDKKLSWFTYQVKSERSFDVVVSGLHKSFNIDDLRAFLALEGHSLRSASVMQRKVFDKDSEKNIMIPMDKFMVHLEPKPNNKEIYSVKYIDHCVVNIEPPHRRRGGPAQCKNCQSRGHTTNFCHRAPVCVKCAGNHHTSKCTMSITEKVKCANCHGDHTANYLGCPDYQKRLRPRTQQWPQQTEHFNLNDHQFMPPQQRFQQRAQPPPPPEPQVRSNLSYSDVIRQEQFMRKIEELMEKQIEMSNTLMNMMSTLISHLCRK